MLLMFENGIRGVIRQATHRYAKANNKYLSNYDNNIKLSYIEFLDANNLYGWAMLQKLPVIIFNWVEELSKFDERFIKNYDKNSNIGYALEVDVEYPIKLRIFHNDLAFLPERKKKRVRRTYLYCRRQKKYGIHITAPKQAVSHGLILKRVHRVI